MVSFIWMKLLQDWMAGGVGTGWAMGIAAIQERLFQGAA
jgi:hypothetical protein